MLRKKWDKKKAGEMRDSPSNANRRAGAIFALACLKRTMGSQVRLEHFSSVVSVSLSQLASMLVFVWILVLVVRFRICWCSTADFYDFSNVDTDAI